jgi:hypothetical protein
MGSRLILGRLALARTLPPGVVAQRAIGMARRRLAAILSFQRDLRRSTYARPGPAGLLHAVCNPVPADLLQPHRSWIEATAALFIGHRFDLLGSGWMQVAHGVDCPGFNGVKHPPGPAVTADAYGDWLTGRINRANLAESQRIWRLVDPGYRPIDWQLDFRSGHRWREDCWSGNVAFGSLAYVDVKVPWELARMQHVIALAWAHRLCGPEGVRYAREFRNQVLDFIATNPPRFGVNWRCAMDVGIRAANWAVAYGLFRARGANFDQAFEDELKASLVDHGRHIVTHLEIYPDGRSNHYLADICGLAFIAACLPAGKETDGWLAFAAQELAGEAEYQFNGDGSGFEGSTGYHRLSAEMVAYTTALMAGLPEERRKALRVDGESSFSSRPRRLLTNGAPIPGPAHFARLERAAEFALHLAKHDGRMVQIGDNDNGRFLKAHPIYQPASGATPVENHLDHRGLVAAIAALTGRDDLADRADGRLDGQLALALARGRTTASSALRCVAANVRVGSPDTLSTLATGPGVMVEIAIPGGGLNSGLELFGYPEFGVWVFRSDRLYLALRCGPTSSPRAGGSHAHNDQLAIELAIDGEDWIVDPGSYHYCPPEARRNAWRSVAAHAAPKWGDREPNRLDFGIFRLPDQTRARCLYFGDHGFAGEHWGFGARVCRVVTLDDASIIIRDLGLPASPTTVSCKDRESVRRHFAVPVPVSSAYGQLLDGTDA